MYFSIRHIKSKSSSTEQICTDKIFTTVTKTLINNDDYSEEDDDNDPCDDNDEIKDEKDM